MMIRSYSYGVDSSVVLSGNLTRTMMDDWSRVATSGAVGKLYEPVPLSYRSKLDSIYEWPSQ